MKPVLSYYQKELTQPEMDAAHRKAIEWMDKHWTTVDFLICVLRLR